MDGERKSRRAPHRPAGRRRVVKSRVQEGYLARLLRTRRKREAVGAVRACRIGKFFGHLVAETVAPRFAGDPVKGERLGELLRWRLARAPNTEPPYQGEHTEAKPDKHRSIEDHEENSNCKQP